MSFPNNLALERIEQVLHPLQRLLADLRRHADLGEASRRRCPHHSLFIQ
jgi:hypothetical protein